MTYIARVAAMSCSARQPVIVPPARHLILIIAFGTIVVFATPASTAAQQCETVACWVADCWWVGPQHRRCRRVCRRRCWNPEPRYVQRDPAPAYVPPPTRYEPPRRATYVPPHNRTSPPIDLGLLLIGGAIGLIVIIVIIVAISAVSGNSHARDIALIDRDIAKTNEVTAKLEAAAREADAHVASMLTKARNGGRNG